jgi:RHS repeat-associated protein
MTVRVVHGKGQILSYDAENRLIEVQDSTDTDYFSYDGDGNRVKADVNNAVTYYLGNYLEWTGEAWTMVKYYYTGGGLRVAMRKGANERYWLLTDHLGGTNVTVDTNGVEYGELRYKAFGGTRYTSGTTPTTMRYTGQREEQSLGIYFYNTRYYDPMLGRFIQADSLIPNPSDPPSFDRFAYVRNSPIMYNDPTGHDLNCGVRGSYAAPIDCAEADPNNTHHVHPTNPDTLDITKLDEVGKRHYKTYKAVWNDHSILAWWWYDPRLGGDGHFSINDYMVMVLNAELSGMYDNPAYISDWQEANTRLSYTNNINRSTIGMLDFIASLVGNIRMLPENYYLENVNITGLDVAIQTLMTIWNPIATGHGEWKDGCVAGRPCYPGSHTPGSGKYLYYIFLFIAAGCQPTTGELFGDCTGRFSFFLDPILANDWHDKYCKVYPDDPIYCDKK